MSLIDARAEVHLYTFVEARDLSVESFRDFFPQLHVRVNDRQFLAFHQWVHCVHITPYNRLF